MQGEMSAMFLRHEGFLGAVGAFLKVHPLSPAALQNHTSKEPRKVLLACMPSASCSLPFVILPVHNTPASECQQQATFVFHLCLLVLQYSLCRFQRC